MAVVLMCVRVVALSIISGNLFYENQALKHDNNFWKEELAKELNV